MKTIMLLLIRFYRRFISPLKIPCCRFYPTCSEYALAAVSEHGALRGGFFALRRILKCHPFHPGGIDYVPKGSEQLTNNK
jgi:putative membrane protein insertion efficiency factor